MKKEDKIAKKIIAKGFTVRDWMSFSDEIKQNESVLAVLAAQLDKYDAMTIKSITDTHPYVISHLSKRAQFSIVNGDNFRYLSEQYQFEIIDTKATKLKYASEDVQVKYVLQNPRYLVYMDPSMQKKMIERNNFFLKYAVKDVQIQLASSHPSLLGKCANIIQCYFIKNNPNYYRYCSSEVKTNVISISNLNPEKISVETFEDYMSDHSRDLSVEELENYKTKVQHTDREDRKNILNNMEYYISNLKKKKM